MKLSLEVCAFGIQSCMIAEKAGAVRVELCDNPIEERYYTILRHHKKGKGKNSH